MNPISISYCCQIRKPNDSVAVVQSRCLKRAQNAWRVASVRLAILSTPALKAVSKIATRRHFAHEGPPSSLIILAERVEQVLSIAGALRSLCKRTHPALPPHTRGILVHILHIAKERVQGLDGRRLAWLRLSHVEEVREILARHRLARMKWEPHLPVVSLLLWSCALRDRSIRSPSLRRRRKPRII